MNAVITGASRGIGRAIAEKYASLGHDILICSKNLRLLEDTAEDIRKSYPAVQVRAKAADLSKRPDIADFAEWCLSHGEPDILVNNAGIYLPGNVHDEPEGQMEKIMDINFYSAYHLTRFLLPSMIQRRRGHIFNISSIASLDAYPGGGAYSISKYALMGFSKNLRYELRDKGVKVTTIYSGAVETDTWGGFDNSNSRIMLASDIADTIAAAGSLSSQAVIEDIIIRPQLGDL